MTTNRVHGLENSRWEISRKFFWLPTFLIGPTQKTTFLSLTRSKSSQVEHQPQQNQPRIWGGAVVIGPVSLISHEGRIWTSERRRHIPLAVVQLDTGCDWNRPSKSHKRAGALLCILWLTCPMLRARWTPYWPTRRRRRWVLSRSHGNRSHSEGPAYMARTSCKPNSGI